MQLKYNGLKVFSATMHKDRDVLGERVTEWLDKNNVELVDTVVTQSSDSEFHCTTIVVFFNRVHK